MISVGKEVQARLLSGKCPGFLEKVLPKLSLEETVGVVWKEVETGNSVPEAGTVRSQEEAQSSCSAVWGVEAQEVSMERVGRASSPALPGPRKWWNPGLALGAQACAAVSQADTLNVEGKGTAYTHWGSRG